MVRAFQQSPYRLSCTRKTVNITQRVRSVAVEQQTVQPGKASAVYFLALLDLPTAPMEALVPWTAAETVVVVSAAVVAEPLEPQQVVVQDDLDQLLDMLPADLGGLLINHPKRPQLIEVSRGSGRNSNVLLMLF
jgi:hypothetical protein